MKNKKLYPLDLIYPLGPPKGLWFSAWLKIRFGPLGIVLWVGNQRLTLEGVTTNI